MAKKRNTKFILVGRDIDFMCDRRMEPLFFSSEEEAKNTAVANGWYAYKLYKAERLTRKGKPFYARPELVANIIFGELLSCEQVEELVAKNPSSEHYKFFLEKMKRSGLDKAAHVLGCRLYDPGDAQVVARPRKA